MNALEITSGRELAEFVPTVVYLDHTSYSVLTGHEVEGPGICFWCGGVLKGKLKRYCRGHMTEYYDHFEWQYASAEAKRRADYKCENCGSLYNIEVHHIVPLEGRARFFSAFNLPFNLCVLCHSCHQEIHAAMRPPKETELDKAVKAGQLAMSIS